MPKRIQSFPIYPLLLGLYPLLYLWNANREQQPAYVILPSLAVTSIFLLVIFLLAWVFTRNPHRAALLATIPSLFVLSYGHFFNLLQRSNPELTHRLLLPVLSIIVLIFLLILAMQRAGSPALTTTLNIVSIALVLLQLVTALPYYYTIAQLDKQAGRERSVQQQSAKVKPVPQTGGGSDLDKAQNRPRDVYYILVDNYGRQDVLFNSSRFDNSELVKALQERGFVFPDCAQSNYPWTAPVVTSVLSMEYLDTLGIPETSYTKRGKYGDMAPYIQDSEVIKKFRAYGYHVVTFRGFMGLIDIQNSDTYVSFEEDISYVRRLETTKFQDLYYETTLFAAVNHELKIYPDLIMEKGPKFLVDMLPEPPPMEPKFLKEYQQTIYAYDRLESIPLEIPGPKFVYAHMYSAHWPHLIEPDGDMRLPVSEKITVAGYVDGVRYTNNRLLKAIDTILANSETDPIIIVQGDHSNGWVGKVEWSGKDRMKILSAYYLPDGGDALLYDEISPVNNFRLIFQHYFGEDLELLPDRANYLDPVTRKIRVAPKSCISYGDPKQANDKLPEVKQ